MSRNEEWKIEMDGKISVSNLGRIKSHIRVPAGKELSQSLNSSGFLKVSILSKSYMVHKLVAEAYVPNPDSLKYIRIIDGNKLNCTTGNLEWCNYRLNEASREKIRDKLTVIPEEDIAIIFSEESRFKSIHELAFEVGVSPGYVSQIQRGLSRKPKP